MSDLRPLAPGELGAAAEIVSRSFKHAYATLLPAADVTPLTPESVLSEWMSQRETTVLGLLRDQTLIGVARVGPDPDAATTGHLFSLYVTPENQGQGLGKQLLSAAEHALLTQGFAEATLWVFDGNDPALALYTRQEWVQSGVKDTGGRWSVPRLQLRKRLVTS